MVTEFYCDGANMKTIGEDLKTVEEYLKAAYTKAETVKNEIDQDGKWSGNSQKTMAAFLDLLMQYHKAFIHGEDAPLPKGIEHLEELMKSLEEFYTNWQEYEDLGHL